MKKILYSLLLGTFMFTACTTNFDSYNTNPNGGEWESVLPTALLEHTLNAGSSDFLNQTRLLNGELMQYTVSGSGLNSYHRYSINNATQSGSWTAMYRWASNADHMYRLSELKDEEGLDPLYNNMKAVALTLKVLFASNVTDIFGDVPYSEAFKARDFNLDKPVFDTQKDIYTTMLQELELANSLYDVLVSLPTTSTSGKSKDLLYNGDMSKWKKFTNSLHLRLLMRLQNRDQEMQVSERMKTILNNPTKYPIFESNEDNAAMFYDGVKPFANRFGDDIWGTSGDRKCAEYIIDLMSPASDPRLPRYFVRSGSEWKGMPSGEYLSEGDNAGIAFIKKESLGSPTSPYAFMKYDEVLFIIAEAAKRKMIPGGEALVEEYYNKAVRASIEWWNSDRVDLKIPAEEVTSLEEDIVTYLTVTSPYDGSMSKLLGQKYIAMFWVGYEAWHDYRRTGYPVLRIGSETQNDHILPTRFAYPMSTANNNPENYSIAVERMRKLYRNGDNMKSPVWWSRQAASMPSAKE